MRLKLRLILLVLVGVFSITLHANAVKLSGVVVDAKTQKPLPNVLVTVRPAGANTVVKFTQTKVDGSFEIEFSTIPDNHELQFRIMGYAPQSVLLKGGKSTFDIALSEKATAIKEVVVKANGIKERGDTITYLVSNFANVQDKTLADVLKKMPGIEVEKSGKISYNGVAINKFYIEGRDMLAGRYGLATNNIHQQDVGSVEVMENHQPIKALQDISFSQNPAINIRLKSDAKSRWVGTAKLGVGVSPFLWKDELLAMRFTSKTQSLSTYKTNNTGVDVTGEAQSLSFEDLFSANGNRYRLASYISVNPDFLDDIDESRVLFNKSHLVSSNNLCALGKSFDLTSQVTYTNNRITSDNYSQLTYFFPDSTLAIEEVEHAFSRQHILSEDVTLTANTSSYYFKNNLSASQKWDNVAMSTTGTYPNQQSANMPHHQISNNLEIIKRSGKRSFSISSFNLFQSRPQDLTVTRSAIQQQHISSTAFFTNTSTSLAFAVKPVTLALKVGVLGVARSLESDLKGVSDTLGLLSNDNTMRYLNLYLTPKMEMKQNSFEANFEIPLSLNSYGYNDKVQSERSSATRLFLSPKLYLKYYFTSRLFASLSGRIAQSPLEEQQFYSGIILRNYRNLSQGLVDYCTRQSKSITGSLSYKHPIKGFFANASFSKVWNHSPRLSNQQYFDGYIMNTYELRDNNSDMWMLNGSVSKRIDAIGALLSLRSSYSLSSSSILQNSIAMPYDFDRWEVSPKITSSISKWCNIAYEMRFAKEWQQMKSIDTRSSFEHFSQKLTCSINPSERWYVRLTGEHYNNDVANNKSKELFLADADFTYCFKGGWELNLSATNLFNRNVYAYTFFDGITNVSKAYCIRSRSIMVSLFFRY